MFNGYSTAGTDKESESQSICVGFMYDKHKSFNGCDTAGTDMKS